MHYRQAILQRAELWCNKVLDPSNVETAPQVPVSNVIAGCMFKALCSMTTAE